MSKQVAAFMNNTAPRDKYYVSEVEQPCKDGSTVWTEVITRFYLDESTGHICVHGVTRDISERKKLESERLKSHMLESVGILAGGIAHDFNNLLSVIIGNIGLAKLRMKPDDKAYQPIINAELNCNRASELSSRLITFSTGGEPIKHVVSLSGYLVDVISDSLHGSTVSPEFHLPDDLYRVLVDERQLKQVVQNLVLNAKEAMPKGGKLIISGKNHHVSDQDSTALQAGKYVMISFKDEGVGISSDNLAKIFDPYYSTKDTYSVKGLGLGLAVCYSIIKRHNGLVTVESEVDKGTTFHMYIPAVG
jgi:signal transduction histidine kinase